MYDFNLFELPFQFGFNLETIAFILNVFIPIVYFLNFSLLYKKIKQFPSNNLLKSLCYFFFFYGIGALYFVWFDFFYMDFTIGVNPIGFLYGFAMPSSEEYLHINEAMQFWKIGICIQNIGLIFMLFELRNKIFTNDTMKKIPLIWEIIGFCILLTWGFIPIFSEAQNYFLIEMNFLFNFSLSLSLPLTNRLIYKSVAKNKSDKEKNNQVRIYTGIIYYGIMSYGLFWGFRTRLAFFIGQYFSSTIGTIPLTFHQTWFLRGLLIVFLQLLVYFAYNKLFDSLKR